MILLLYPVNTFLSQTRTQTVLTFCPVTLFHRNEKVQFSLNSLLFSSLLSQNSEVFVNLKKAEMTGFFIVGLLMVFRTRALLFVKGMLTGNTAKTPRIVTGQKVE